MSGQYRFSLRHGCETDAPAIADLHVRSWRATYRGILPDAYLDGLVEEERRTHWQKALSGQRTTDLLLVAELKGRLAGFIATRTVAEGRFGPSIDNLHVDPEMHGGGIGSALLGAAASQLAVTGQACMHLWVYDDNKSAYAFYLKLGGLVAEHGYEDFLGLEIPHTRIVWNDLRRLADRCRSRTGG